MGSVVMTALSLLLIFPIVLGEIQVYVTTFSDRKALAIIAEMTAEPYAEVRSRFLVGFTDGASEFMTRSRLSKQNPLGKPPPHWITLTLIGRVHDRTTLLLRSDNLYLIGFNNSQGQWYAFKGYKNLIPNSIELDYSVTYSSLLGVDKGGKWRLPQLALGKEFFLDSIYALSSYPSDRRFNLGIALAKIIVMSLEAVRFIPIGDRVEMIWSTEGHIDMQLVDYAVNWAEMSYLLLCSQEGYPWGGREGKELTDIGIGTPQAAINILNIVLYAKAYDVPDKFRCRSTLQSPHGSYGMWGN